MAITLTPTQRQALDHPGHLLLQGMPGTGKTAVLIEKIAQLIAQGIKPEDIAVGTFAWRALQHTRALLRQRLGPDASRLNTGTLVDFALAQLSTNAPQPLKYLDNTQVRLLLRQAMKNVVFEGTVNEAEHLIRAFKGRASKPKEHEPHVNLFQAYQERLTKLDLIDRHDVMRKHLIAMRNETAAPCRFKYLVVDNLQDATQIQTLWLTEHASAGTKLIVAGDDDLSVFVRSGAMGARAFHDLSEGLQNLHEVTLTENFRLSSQMIKAAKAVVKELGDRVEKDSTPQGNTQGKIQIIPTPEPHAELALLVANIIQIRQNNPANHRIGVVVRHDLAARQVCHALAQAGIVYTDFSRSLWESPSANLILDILQLLIDVASDQNLKNVLVGYGLTPGVVDQLYAHGLRAEKWLKQGAPLPTGVDLPPGATQDVARIRRRLVSYHTMLTKENPKKVFKAAVLDALELMTDEDKVRALYALEFLLGLKGKLSEQLQALRALPEPDPMALVLVAPVREVRNMEFDTVLMPFCGKNSYPYAYKVTGIKHAGDRRKFYLAMTRAKQNLIISYHDKPSPYLKDVEAALPTQG